MSRKVTIFLVFLLSFKLFSQEQEKSLFINQDASFRDYFIATGEMIFVDLLVYDVNNLFLSSKPTETSFQVFKDNLTSPWIFDYSSFKRNQLLHPYFGSLYYLSGRSNNLNFQESFLLSAAGSFLWEAYFEGPVASLNDFITTPTAGAITGEILHRLSYSVYEYSPFASWILSPMDGINQLLQNKRAVSPSGKIYSQDYSVLCGIAISDSSYNNDFTPAAGVAMNLVYNNPYGHTSREFYDQFTVDFYYSCWPDNQLMKLNLDGILYSHSIIPAETFASTFGISFDYDVIYGSNITLSDSSLGLCLKQAFGDKKNSQFNYSIQGDFVYLATSDIFYMTKDENQNYTKPKNQASYTYKYGPELKISLEFSDALLGNISWNSALQYLFTYNSSTSNNKLKTDLFVFNGDFSYEHKIYKNIYAGIRDILIIKNEFSAADFSGLEFTNHSDLYIKFKI